VLQTIKEVLQVGCMNQIKQSCPSMLFYALGLTVIPVQSLVDDGMVHQERIGSSNYFW